MEERHVCDESILEPYRYVRIYHLLLKYHVDDDHSYLPIR
jgi:hypothetical protein